MSTQAGVDTFKFTALRAPQLARSPVTAKVYNPEIGYSDFYDKLVRAKRSNNTEVAAAIDRINRIQEQIMKNTSEGRSVPRALADQLIGATRDLLSIQRSNRREMHEIAKGFLGSPQKVTSIRELDSKLQDFSKVVRKLVKPNSNSNLNDIDTLIENNFGSRASNFVKGRHYKEIRFRVADTVTALNFSGENEISNRDDIVHAIRLFELIENVGRNDEITKRSNWIKLILESIVVMPSEIFASPNSTFMIPNLTRYEEPAISEDSGNEFLRLKKIFNDLKNISDESKNMLTEANLSINDINIEKASVLLSKKVEETRFKDPNFIAHISNPIISDSPGLSTRILPHIPTSASLPCRSTYSNPVIGVGDLMVVRQEIKKYLVGEISHIENVLTGESKERTHRRVERKEETIVVETERVEEREQELSSTERFEMQSETQEIINEQSSTQFGITTNYSGISIDVGTNFGFASANSSQESKTFANSYSRDVTQRALERVQERVRQVRTTRLIQEVEEINKHGINNEDEAQHVRGIYQWLDKLYDARLYNYGKRIMLDFIIPEPAIFYRFFIEHDKTQNSIKEPVPPYFWQPIPGIPFPLRIRPLSPDDLNKGNYLGYAGMFAAEVDEYPREEISYSVVFNVDKAIDEEFVFSKSHNISIEEGYYADSAKLQVHNAGRLQARTDHRKAFALVGGKYLLADFHGGDNATEETLDRQQKNLGVSVGGYGINNISLVVDIKCKLDRSKLEEWQVKTFRKIMDSYNEAKSKYDEKISTQQVESGVEGAGKNTAINRQIEKSELKKSCISILRRSYYDEFGAIVNGSYDYPQLDFDLAATQGAIVQFFEQAFEWEQIMYIFYPYFWSNKREWLNLLRTDDVDPVFAEFLKAGAARVMVPIRRNYEEAVYHFLETDRGCIWDGGDRPHIDQNLYISLVDEIRERQGYDFEEGEGTISVTMGDKKVTGKDTEFTEEDVDREILVKGLKYRIATVISGTEIELTDQYGGATEVDIPYSLSEYQLVGEPWEVKVPTSLVYLKQDGNLNDLF
jgi:hypothetical protein